MTRTVTLLGYAVIAATLAGYHVFGVVRRRTPTLAEAVAVATRHPWVRVLVLAFWLWLGWHLFVRASWPA